jgi:peptide-methionine (S)-S-oxide reductase
VVATKVGYAGGTTPDPDYHHTGDHHESVEVTYDPAVTSYDRLLEVFWASHPAVGGQGPVRTREAALYVGAAQERAARASRRRVARAAGEPVTTAVEPLGRFWPAEAYNQKANLQRLAPDLVRQLAARFGGRDGFLASTAAARLNAYAGGLAGEDALRDAARELQIPVEELEAKIGPTEGTYCPRAR